MESNAFAANLLPSLFIYTVSCWIWYVNLNWLFTRLNYQSYNIVSSLFRFSSIISLRCQQLHRIVSKVAVNDALGGVWKEAIVAEAFA
jgi:hypothetical protein